jgi:fumarate reductase flavoprotein subunit
VEKINTDKEATSVKWWDEETDVAIAGGSYAGLAAAVGAGDLGAGVLVLEKGKDSLHPVGRDGRGLVGIFAVESALQKKEGINLTRDWAFKYALESAHWRCNIRLVRRIIDESAGLIDWLMQHGVTFTDVRKIIPHYPADWHCFGDQSLEVIRALTKCAVDRHVQLMYQAAASELIVSPAGQVVGIKAMVGGRMLRIKAGEVVLATGGTPLKTEDKFPAADQSDGIRMAGSAGAVIDYTEQYTYGFGLTRFIPPELDELMRVPEQPFLFVNKFGERVFDEGLTYQPEMLNVAEFQKDQTLVQIFDESSKNNLMNSGVKFLQHGTQFQRLTGLDVQIQEGLNKGLIEKASTLKELAARIMVDSVTLEKTVAQYNRFCDQKHDDLFLKDPEYLEPVREPPFYAIVCDQQFAYGGRAGAKRSSGVRIDTNCRALDRSNNAVPGLYVAGKDAAGMYGSVYPLCLAGINLTFEIGTGKIAGENAADFP